MPDRSAEMGVTYVLYECSSGFGLFEQVKTEEISITEDSVQDCIKDLQKFSQIVKLTSFLPFTSAENALESINRISEGEITAELANFLETNVPKKKATLGVIDPKVGNVVSEQLGIKCKCNTLIMELVRGIRTHFERYIKGLKPGDMQQAQLGLGHSYSRAKVKFNVHRVDNMIVQSIALLDQLDKDLNTFQMRVREWYGYHFPELYQVVKDPYHYCCLAKLIKDRTQLTEAMIPQIEAILDDPEAAKQVMSAAAMSMGSDISPIDMLNIEQFASRVAGLTQYRKKLHHYLSTKMTNCAPNLSALIGEIVGARLIAHAGSLTSLAKYPASTVQILGAEKALFRALKTKGNTPKYGLIFHSSFIGRAKPKNKGRISRYLANKCSLASRIDCFGEQESSSYGAKMRDQVEERLEFYKSGKAPRKNIDVMNEAIKMAQEEEDAAEGGSAETPKEKKKKDKKSKKRGRLKRSQLRQLQQQNQKKRRKRRIKSRRKRFE